MIGLRGSSRHDFHAMEVVLGAGVAMRADWLFALSVLVVVSFIGGMNFAETDPFPEFVPKFGEGDSESYKCYLMAERVDGRTVYKGCYSLAILEDMRANWAEIGLDWRIFPVAEYDRERDPFDMNPRW